MFHLITWESVLKNQNWSRKTANDIVLSVKNTKLWSTIRIKMQFHFFFLLSSVIPSEAVFSDAHNSVNFWGTELFYSSNERKLSASYESINGFSLGTSVFLNKFLKMREIAKKTTIKLFTSFWSRSAQKSLYLCTRDQNTTN